MSAAAKPDELSILLEGLNDEREAKIKIGIWLEGIVFCSLIGLLGLGVLNRSILKFLICKVYLWKWVVLGLAIILSRLVSQVTIKFTLYLLKLNHLCRVRVLFFVTKEKNHLHMFFWSMMVFSAWYLLTYQFIERERKITKSEHVMLILFFLMAVGCFTWLMTSILFRLHKIACLRRKYFDRVRKSTLEQCVLKVLLSSSPECQDCEISTFNDVSQLHKKDVTACIMDKLMNMVGDRSLPSVEVVVTKSIIRNVIKMGSSSNQVEKVKKFLSEQSALTINLFEREEINENALHIWVVSAYKDRRTLLSDMEKTDVAITKIHLIIIIVVGLIILETWLIYSYVKNKHNNKKDKSNH